MSSSNPSPVIPSEVGWQFVPQYYTFVNKQPNRLHCFYTKASTFIHGTEGEDGKPCHGQQEIHNKITSIGFQDCKVFIHSVDAQSSASGGIIIQVIGEMSNHNEPWRKFVQTFFLAEQPNGYFVLNDIFRFLKEETVESDDGADAADEATPATNQEPAPAQDPTQHEPISIPREPTPLPVVTAPIPAPAPPSPAPTEDPPTSDIPEPPTIVQKSPNPPPEPLPTSTSTTTTTTVVQPPAQPNGIHPTTASEPEKPAVAPAPVVVEKSPTPAPSSPALPPAQAAPAPVAVAPPAAATSTPSASVSAPPPAAPAPAPAAPRSWASLAASNPRKWGSAVAQESRGTTEIPVAVNVGVNSNSNAGGAPGTQTPPRAPPHHHHQHQHQGPAGGQGQQGLHPNYIAAQNTTVAQCFVKGVIEPISQTTLTGFLTQRFGAVKDVEIVRSKACAFLEFLSLDAARRAIIASLPQGQGGEGGLWIEVGGDVGQVRISVEMKKERGDRPVSRPRGGAPGAAVNGEAVGSGQGVGGGAGRGSGGGGGGNFRGRGGMRGRGGGGGGSGTVGK